MDAKATEPFWQELFGERYQLEPKCRGDGQASTITSVNMTVAAAAAAVAAAVQHHAAPAPAA